MKFSKPNCTFCDRVYTDDRTQWWWFSNYASEALSICVSGFACSICSNEVYGNQPCRDPNKFKKDKQ